MAHPHWRWHVAGAALLAAVVFQLPKYHHLYAQLIAHTEPLPESLGRIEEQAAHPFAPHADPAATHLAKMSFRLAVPLLLRVLHLPLVALVALQAVIGLLTFYYAAGLLAASQRDRVAAALLVVALSRTYFGYAFTYDLVGYFDGFGYAALLYLLGARRWWLVFAVLLAAAFVDERVLVASPLLLVAYGARRYHWQAVGHRWLLAAPATAVYAAWGTYAAVRLALAARYHLPTAGGLVGRSALAFSFQHELVALGFADSFKSFWLPVALAVAWLGHERRWPLLAVLLAGFAPIFLGSFLITDITRSLSYGLPMAFLCLALLARHSSLPARRHLAATVLFFALLMPSYFTTGWLQYAGPAWQVALRQWLMH